MDVGSVSVSGKGEEAAAVIYAMGGCLPRDSIDLVAHTSLD